MKALFGPGGNSESFYADGNTTTKLAPGWIKRLGLDAYEYEAGNGLSATRETLIEIGRAALENDIKLSYHAPYFISLSGIVEEKRLNSIRYIDESLKAADLLGAKTIVVHTGSAAKISRDEAMKLASDTLIRTVYTVDTRGIKIGLETMGKINQLGTLDEVIEQCKVDPHYVPCVDFGHLNARNIGGMFNTVDDYRRVFHRIGESLGDEVAKNLHCHFSKIEYINSGEKKHLTFADDTYGPEFEPLIEAIIMDNLTPRIICESDGTQPEDALKMKKYYLENLK